MSAITAPFDAEYAARFLSPISPATDATLTIAPPPRAFMPGITCLQQRNVPRALTAKTSSQTSSEVPGASAVEPIPGGVDEHLDAVHRLCDLCLVADVQPQRGRSELGRDRVRVEVGDGDVEAVVGEPVRHRRADP